MSAPTRPGSGAGRSVPDGGRSVPGAVADGGEESESAGSETALATSNCEPARSKPEPAIPTPAPPAPRARRTRTAGVVVVLCALLVIGAIASATLGQLPISPREVLFAILERVGIGHPGPPVEPLMAETLWQIRFPRLVMSLLVGGLLAVAGAVMQAVFGNPLAEPGVVGVSAGAAVGAAIAITAGVAVFGNWSITVFAFIGGLVATIVVYSTARSSGRTEVVTLLLTGIAINAFCGAALAMTLFLGSTASREQIVFWQLGSVNGSRWSEVAVVVVGGVVGVAISLAFARQYDLLSLGERTAGHLGVRVERLRIISIVVVALLTSVSVAFVGIIGFVGLVVPHVIRMLLGPGHRMLILCSLLGGAVLLVWADLAARTLAQQADLPIGLLTALVGGPFFFYLIRRTRRQAGGWG